MRDMAHKNVKIIEKVGRSFNDISYCRLTYLKLDIIDSGIKQHPLENVVIVMED
jgi:hypothetical protein